MAILPVRIVATPRKAKSRLLEFLLEAYSKRLDVWARGVAVR